MWRSGTSMLTAKTVQKPLCRKSYGPKATRLLLATHDTFFGDRHSLLTPNYGGTSLRARSGLGFRVELGIWGLRGV